MGEKRAIGEATSRRWRPRRPMQQAHQACNRGPGTKAWYAWRSGESKESLVARMQRWGYMQLSRALRMLMAAQLGCSQRESLNTKIGNDRDD